MSGVWLHVWLTRFSHLAGRPDALALARQDLPAEEQRRFDGLPVQRVAQRATLGRSFARRCLAQYVGCAPSSLEWQRGANGKPHLGAEGPAFSVSHCDEWFVLAVSNAPTVGVDVEWAGRATAWRKLSTRFFAPREQVQLESSPEAERADRFTALWTLKEAYFKARGSGIGEGLHKAAFEVTDGGAVLAHLSPELGDEPDAWRFSWRRLGGGFCVATATATGDGKVVEPTFRFV